MITRCAPGAPRPRACRRAPPRLLSGPSAGYPVVYDIAIDLVSHGDGRVDAGSLSAFVSAYQTVKPLKLGELWAIPIMLRLALINNLRRVAARIAADRLPGRPPDQKAGPR